MPKWTAKAHLDEEYEDRSAVIDAFDRAIGDIGVLPADYDARMAAAEAVYLGHRKRDDPFKRQFSVRLRAARRQINDGELRPGQYFSLLGSSGAGKSTMMLRTLRASGITEPIELTGRTLRPAIYVHGPRPFTKGDFAVAILRQLGMVTDSSLQAKDAARIVENHLPRSKTNLIVVDEAQHVLRHNEGHAKDVRDWIKILAGRPAWPVSFVFVGIPIFKRFLETDNQVKNRNTTFEIPALQLHIDDAYVSALVQASLDAAKLTMEEASDEDFIHRVMFASGMHFGRCQNLVLLAISAALAESRSVVTIDDFANGLFEKTQCEEERNSFMAKRPEIISHWINDPELENYVAREDILYNEDDKGRDANKPADDQKKRKQ